VNTSDFPTAVVTVTFRWLKVYFLHYVKQMRENILSIRDLFCCSEAYMKKAQDLARLTE